VIRVARWLLTALLTIGVICGVLRYVGDDGADGIRDLVTAFVGGVADVTYRWVPPTVEFLAGLVSDLSGQAA
jgi:hypothetical protein